MLVFPEFVPESGRLYSMANIWAPKLDVEAGGLLKQDVQQWTESTQAPGTGW